MIGMLATRNNPRVKNARQLGKNRGLMDWPCKSPVLKNALFDVQAITMGCAK